MPPLALKSMLVGREVRPSAKMTGIAGAVFGGSFILYSLLLGGLFGFQYQPKSQTVIPLYYTGSFVLAFGLAAIHSARNNGIVVSWLLGIAVVFPILFHGESGPYGAMTVATTARSVWEAAAFGVPLGTLGFMVGTLTHYLRDREQRTQFPLRDIVAATILGILFGGVLYTGCPIVFGNACFAPNLG